LPARLVAGIREGSPGAEPPGAGHPPVATRELDHELGVAAPPQLLDGAVLQRVEAGAAVVQRAQHGERQGQDRHLGRPPLPPPHRPANVRSTAPAGLCSIATMRRPRTMEPSGRVWAMASGSSWLPPRMWNRSSDSSNRFTSPGLDSDPSP